MDLVTELRQLMAGNEAWGNTFVQNKRIREVLDKYEEQQRQDLLDRPGRYQLKQKIVQAIRHDGSQQSAEDITEWVTNRGGSAVFWNDGYADQQITYINITSNVGTVTVMLDNWVVFEPPGTFGVFTDVKFTQTYETRGRNK